MIRKVFIVGAPLSYETPTFYNGVVNDMESHYNYFTSPTGGAFYTDDIIYLQNPSWNRLKDELYHNPADYVVFVFSGHGYISSKSKDTVCTLNSYESIPLIDIVRRIRSTRQLIVTDSCRNYVDDSHFSFMGDLERTPISPITFPSYISFAKARRVFDNHLRTTNEGIQVLYSSSPGEKSTLSSGGSYFSRSLLHSAREWALNVERKSILLGKGAHTISRNYLFKNFTRKQNPSHYTTDAYANFPFVIRLGTELL